MLVFFLTFLTVRNIFLFGLLVFVLSLLLVSGLSVKSLLKLVCALLPFIILTSAVMFLLFEKTDLLIRVLLRILLLFANFSLFASTTDLFLVVRLLQQLRLPNWLYLPVYIVFRFLPELEKDFMNIRHIQKTRGITPKNGIFTFLKGHFVPVIIMLLERGEELSIAFYLKEKET